MANNYLFLVHRPSSKSVLIGKRMGYGWYIREPEKLGQRLMKFYEEMEGLPGQDDFVLAIEDASGAPYATDDFVYSGRGGGNFQIFLGDSVKKEPAKEPKKS